MSAAIKPGDLVMVVRPNVCCGSTESVGKIGVVEGNPWWATYAECDFCGVVDHDPNHFRTIEGGGYHVDTLQKIEPPTSEEGASMHCELEVVA